MKLTVEKYTFNTEDIVLNSTCYYKDESFGYYRVQDTKIKTNQVLVLVSEGKPWEHEFWVNSNEIWHYVVNIDGKYYPVELKEFPIIKEGQSFKFKRFGNVARLYDKLDKVIALPSPPYAFQPLSIQDRYECNKKNIKFSEIDELDLPINTCKGCDDDFPKRYNLTNGFCFNCLQNKLPNSLLQNTLNNFQLYNSLTETL